MVYGESVRFVYLIPSILLLLGYITAAIVALTARNRYPRSATLGMAGFALMALGSLISLIMSLTSSAFISGGNYQLYSTISLVTSILTVLLQLCGVGLLLMALLKKESPDQGAPPAGLYGGQQYPAQYPGQQPQQWQQYPPQYPGQQYRGY